MALKVEGLPSSVRVAGHDIAVEVKTHQWAAGARRHGEFSGCEQRIALEPSSASGSCAAETVLHEVMHAVWWGFNLHDGDPEERTVTTLAAGLMQVWRDNPELMAWIDKAAKS